MVKLKVGDYVRKTYGTGEKVIYKIIKVDYDNFCSGLTIFVYNDKGTNIKVGKEIYHLFLIHAKHNCNYEILSKDEVLMEML